MEVFWSNISGLEGQKPRHPGRTRSPGSGFVWSLLTEAVRVVWGCELPEAGALPGGKPYFPSRPDICFSLSHTKGAVLAAVSDRPIGADVERCKEVRPALERRLRELPRGDLKLFELWTLCESWYKLTGEGDLREIPFSRESGIITGPSPDLRCRLYEEIPGCAAAVCSLSETPSQKLLYIPPERLILPDRNADILT